MAGLVKNVAGQNIKFGLINVTTGLALSGASVSTYVAIDGAALYTATAVVSSLGQGQYNFPPAQADTNGTNVGYTFNAAGAIPVTYNFHTDAGVDANGYAFVSPQGGTVGTVTYCVNVATVTTALTSNTVGTVTYAVNVGTVTTVLTTNVANNVGTVTTVITAGTVGTVTYAVNVGTVTTVLTANVVGTAGTVTTAVGLGTAYDFAKGTVAITEAYRANGAAPTPAQAFCEILAHLGEVAIAGLTKTAYKFDHITAAATYTIDSSVTPTIIHRAT